MAHHTADDTKLPGTREELLALHRETRRQRNAAPHGSPAHVAAIRAATARTTRSAIAGRSDPPKDGTWASKDSTSFSVMS